MGWRSTTLRLASNHCPRAVDFFEAGAPSDRRVFETGIAAHACLQEAGEKQPSEENIQPLFEAVAEQLMTHGRSFDGRPEPPLSADRVWEGVEIAESYVDFAGLPPEGADYEVGLAVDSEWRPVSYSSPRAAWKGIMDVRYWDGNELTDFLVIRDYKTSWAEDEIWLKSIQAKLYLSLALSHLEAGREQAEIIRLQITNLRTWKTHSGDFPVADSAMREEIRRWRRQIEATGRALDRRDDDGRRQARPGANCVGCPFLTQCHEGTAALRIEGVPASAEEAARKYSAAVATVAALTPVMKSYAKTSPVDIPKGGSVGWIRQERRTLADGAYATVWEAWEASGGDARGFAHRVVGGVGAAETIAKECLPKEEREAWIDALTEIQHYRKFGPIPARNKGAS